MIAQYSGLLKAGAKNNIAVKKNEYNQNLISIKERNYSDRVVNASIPKLSIDELKSLAEMSTMELGKQMYEYDIYANIFEHVYNLIIHSTTIMNSILKRDHANDGNRQFGPAGF